MDCFLYLKNQVSKFPTEKAFVTDLVSYIERVNEADYVQPDDKISLSTENKIRSRRQEIKGSPILDSSPKICTN